MDAKLMEEIFSNEYSLSNLPSFTSEASEESIRDMERILTHMSRISPIEADMVELHLLKGVSQALLGKIFGYTQPNVHYRISRGIERLRVYMQITMYTEDELRERLSGLFTCQRDIDVMAYLYIYSSQSHVARMLGDTQGKVRYRYLKCLESLERAPNMADIYTSMKVLGENLTLLRVDPEDYVQKRVLL